MGDRRAAPPPKESSKERMGAFVCRSSYVSDLDPNRNTNYQRVIWCVFKSGTPVVQLSQALVLLRLRCHLLVSTQSPCRPRRPRLRPRLRQTLADHGGPVLPQLRMTTYISATRLGTDLRTTASNTLQYRIYSYLSRDLFRYAVCV